MGNYRFRLSSMISTSWFLKLKHLVNVRAKNAQPSHPHPHHHLHHSHSIKKKKPPQSTAAPAAAVSLPPSMQPNRASYYIPSHHRNVRSPAVPPAAKQAKPRARRADSALCANAARKKSGEGDDLEVAASQLKLPPILTKPAAPGPEEECSTTTPSGRRFRVRRMSSPRGGRRQRGRGLRGSGEGLVVMKASADPSRDFAESMLEMIMANGIRGGRELEELLVCYLSLNAKEYHEVIVKVFERVWFLLLAASDSGV